MDCPIRRRGFAQALVGGSDSSRCSLISVAVEEREVLPPGLFNNHAFGLVRRGVLVRERTHPSGARIAIDAAGPGAYVPLAGSVGCTGYAASRVLLCVYPEPVYTPEPGEEQLTADLNCLLRETLERVECIIEASRRASAEERVDAVMETLTAWLGAGAPEKLLQRDLAALVGMRVETVCRVLRVRAARRQPVLHE